MTIIKKKKKLHHIGEILEKLIIFQYINFHKNQACYIGNILIVCLSKTFFFIVYHHD